MEWIDVNERLPVGIDEVIFYDKIYDVWAGRYWRGRFEIWDNEDWEPLKNVTHWMPLPQKPKEI